MRYCSRVYGITAQDIDELEHRRYAFIAETGTRKVVQIVLVTNGQIKRNSYLDSIHSHVTGDELFP
jgi:hypothetical protein